MPLQRDTVAIPFSSGIKPSTRARLLDPQKLLTAQNCFFQLDQGPQKRFGHVEHLVRTSADYVGLNGITAPTAMSPRDTFSAANPGIPASWLYGWGIYGATQTDSSVPFSVSPQPDVGQLFGAAVRDTEVLSWDGHRLFSLAPNQPFKFGELQSGNLATATRGPACMPALRAQSIAKTSTSQAFPDAADNGVLRVVAWANPDGITVGYSAYDSTNRACLVSNATLTFQNTSNIRVIAVDGWFHILCADATANSLEVRSFHQENPASVRSTSLGPTSLSMDVKKIDETKWVVAKAKTNVVSLFVMAPDATILATLTPALGGFAATDNLGLACEIDANGNIGLLWTTTGAPFQINFGVFNQAGGTVFARQAVATTAASRRLTLSPRFVAITGINPLWDVYLEDFVSSVAQVRSYAVIPGGAATLMSTRFRIVLASHAVRAGNRTFVWCGSWFSIANPLQRTWFLCDSALLPIGKLDFATANVDLSSNAYHLASINWHTAAGHPFKDRIVFHGALGYNLRVAVTPISLTVSTTGVQAAPSPVYAESSVQFYELDFLPKMRAAQAGRSVYFAGAQLWACDGAEVVESGFHMAPEGVTGTAAGSGGSLSAGTYRYRVDLCHKNLQNEEIRSWSIVTNGITAVNNDKITVSIPVMPMTRREDSYLLIFRTASNGTVYYLCNSRDPSSANFLKNDQTQVTLSYQDSLADATLTTGEWYPSNSIGTYVDPLPAPACELVAAGRDRLWLAGGELSPGELAPSRLFYPGQTPAYSPALNIQVDRNAEPISAIGFVGDLTAIFRRTNVYILDSDGPDNSFSGIWTQPRQSVADTGAVSPDGMVLSVQGLWFLSPAGLRRLNNSGGMDDQAGHDMDPTARAAILSGAMVIPQFTQIRWYSRDPAQPSLTYDYGSDAWTTYTGVTAVGAIFWTSTNLAVLTRGDGKVWVEVQGVYTDGGTPYEMIVRSSWLHGGALGDFQRVRRLALFGAVTMPTSPEQLNLRMRLYYDERPFYDEQIVRAIPQSGAAGLWNVSTWGGAATWGTSGPWGDETNTQTDALFFRDSVFRLRGRPHRQKCSVFSVEFSDQGCVSGRFEPVVLALELGKKPGLDRIPT
jgi:hypothetical protein